MTSSKGLYIAEADAAFKAKGFLRPSLSGLHQTQELPETKEASAGDSEAAIK